MKLIGKTQEGNAIVELTEAELIGLRMCSGKAENWYKNHGDKILYNVATHYYGELDYILDQI